MMSCMRWLRPARLYVACLVMVASSWGSERGLGLLPAEASFSAIKGLSLPDEKVMMYQVDTVTPPGHRLLDAHVDFPHAKLLRSTERAFLKEAGAEYQCTSADGPFCFMRLEQERATAAEQAKASARSDLIVEVVQLEDFNHILEMGPGLVFFHAVQNCWTCAKAKAQLRIAAAELSTAKEEVAVLSVDCDDENGKSICSHQNVNLEDVPDIRLYLKGPSHSIRWGADVQVAASVAQITHQVRGGLHDRKPKPWDKDPRMDDITWDAEQLVGFVTDTNMHSIFNLITQLQPGAGGAVNLPQGIGSQNVFLLDDELSEQLTKMASGQGTVEGLMDKLMSAAEAGGGQGVTKLETPVGKLRSMPSTVKRNIEFVNHTERPMELFWVDFQGAEQSYQKLKPNGNVVLSSFLNHVWLLRDQETSKPVKMIVVVNGLDVQRVVINS